VSTSAPDVIQFGTDRHSIAEKRRLVTGSPRHWGSWVVCIAIFVMAAAATFNGALALSDKHASTPAVVRAALPALPPLQPSVHMTLSPLLVAAPQTSKPKPVDGSSAYDQVHPHHARKPVSDESAAYDPKRATGNATLSQKSTRSNSAKTNPATNW
jgi:hypothetical protein